MAPPSLQLLYQLLEESLHKTVLATIVLTIVFTSSALVLGALVLFKYGWLSPALLYHRDQRRRLPKTIIVIRHGESEANADKTLWKKIPDNLLGLTEKGRDQARRVGHRVAKILEENNAQRVHLVISPFERTLQTAHHLRQAFDDRIVRTEIESRIREQEVGNIQGEDFEKYRQEQKKVGRFWYRFPTGESGADVLDRVKSWWQESVLTTNLRVGYQPVDAIVVVSHGLTIRFMLTQLFGWSPTTFHSVWNAGNCDMYVLQKDLKFSGLSPYTLNTDLGDTPKSSIEVSITLKNGKKHLLKLDHYLGIPPPRTKQTKLMRRMLCKQYPELVSSPKEIREILVMPFVEGGFIRGRSTSGNVSRRMTREDTLEDSESSDEDEDEMIVEETDDMDESRAVRSPPPHRDSEEGQADIKSPQRELSLRHSCFDLQSLLKDIDCCE